MAKRDEVSCTAETTLRMISGRWKVMILYHLFGQVRRFSELRRALPNCTQKMLTQQLREMERDGLVKRKVYAQVPPKVEYSLTPLGESLKPVVDSMCRWGKLKARVCKAPTHISNTKSPSF
jgi:DNA-binding HxlR family transcriptional regulator